jgi:CDP-2,3-bis-(O-geranylgeranyl)-sn-glycerol synthase
LRSPLRWGDSPGPGRFKDGQRITGDGKTFRGTIAGTICGIAAGLLLNNVAPILGMPSFGSGIEQIPILIGLSMGSMAGDLVASFFKRRLGLKRGAKLYLVDQLDFVMGAWALTALLAPEWFWQNFTLSTIAVVLIVTPILHRLTNIIGYKIGAKREPW